MTWSITGVAFYVNGEVVPVIHYEKGNLRDAILAQLEDLGSGRNRSLLLPGRVRLIIHPPVATTGVDEAGLQELIDQVRGIIARPLVPDADHSPG